ncbi:hypothetical protein B0H10DRAFT_2060694, partial [Mycena sp. CBHHK59/15]
MAAREPGRLAAMFLISSFSVFLAPITGIMACDFFVLRRQRMKLTDLYELRGSFYFWHGFNWRADPAWVAGGRPRLPCYGRRRGSTPTRRARCSSAIICPSSGFSYPLPYSTHWTLFPVPGLD